MARPEKTAQTEMGAEVDCSADVPAMGGDSESGDDETTGQGAAPQDERQQATSSKAEVVRGEADEGASGRARTGLGTGSYGPGTPETDDESGSSDKPRAGTRTTATRGARPPEERSPAHESFHECSE